MTESTPKRTNFRHTVLTDTPLGWIYRWVMSSVHRRYKLEQSLTAFWLPIVYEEMDYEIPPEQLKRVALESIRALELQVQVLRHQYGFFPAVSAGQPHDGLYTQSQIIAPNVGKPQIVVAVEQSLLSQAVTPETTIEADYSEYLFDDELSEAQESIDA